MVDVLALASSKKQRTSGHYFVRLGHQGTAVLSNHQFPRSATSRLTALTPRLPAGVPTVATTVPGDEVQDFLKYKAAQDLRNGITDSKTRINMPLSSGQAEDRSLPPTDARRFHLTRDLSLAPRSQLTSGIQKSRLMLRPHLPTFIEKSRSTSREELASHAEPPVDRIIRSVDGANHELDAKRILSKDGTVKKEKTSTFQKPKIAVVKNGQSIHDDPTTWDLTSDRLADELMTLALEMDPDARVAYEAESRSQHDANLPNVYSDAMLLDGPDDFVYETYIRVQEKGIADLADLAQSRNLGYLVIDEEDEDLWEQYLNEEDDDDDEWDEEDADSNAEDNPRNDYPEDEVSSDDEFSRNIYKYRRDHSDDEQYDQDYQ